MKGKYRKQKGDAYSNYSCIVKPLGKTKGVLGLLILKKQTTTVERYKLFA